MSKVIKWLISNRVAVNEHMATKTVNWAPNDAWWIVVCCLNRVMKDVDVAIASLQGKQLQVTMQRQILEGLKVDLSKIAGAGSILGPLMPAAIAPLYETRQLVPLIPTLEDATLLRESHFCNGKFAMKLDDAHKFIDNCGTFVMERLQELSNPIDGRNLSVYALVLDSVACMFVDLIKASTPFKPNEMHQMVMPPRRFNPPVHAFSTAISEQSSLLNLVPAATQTPSLYMGKCSD